ncbi:MAG TPA: hypothetical protein VFZ27_16250 [Terriglobia bacterium]|nr:hypothetical protein [Terriglobia bacterium]
MDGVLALPKEEDREKHQTAILHNLDELLGSATEANLKNLYETVTTDRMLGVVDPLLKQIIGRFRQVNRQRLAAVARYFATQAGHREAVKFGIALLGVVGTPDDVDALIKLGSNDEFSLFAAVAIGRLASEPEKRLWEMAKLVHGWGRIQIVERLVRTNDPQIQAWLLREGFRNSIMDEYLACICARAGRLHEALKAPVLDRPLLDGAADIFRALICGGPAESIDDYENAAEAAESYVNHVWSSRGIDLRHFLAVDDLLRYAEDAARKDGRSRRGWNEEREGQIRALCKDILRREVWDGMVREGLGSSDEMAFYEADLAAHRLGISTRDIHFAKVRAAPTKSSSWYELLRQTNEAQIDEVLHFAESALPLEEIATGPSDSLGLGQEFEPHRALGWVLQGLSRFPGRGWRLIRVGLKSPVVNNRVMSVKALATWREENWPREAIKVFKAALETEPHPGVKQGLGELLRRKPVN